MTTSESEKKKETEKDLQPTSVTPDTSVDVEKKEETEDAAAAKPKKKKKGKKQVTKGCVYVHATYNNTIVSFTDQYGNLLSQSSAGRCGFKGPKKATPYAAGVIVKEAAERLKDIGLKDVDVYVKGIGSGREGAVRAINAQGFNMLSIRDITPTPHNGCRPKKPRRV